MVNGMEEFLREQAKPLEEREEDRLEEIAALVRRDLATWDEMREAMAIRRRQVIRDVRRRREVRDGS